MLLATDSQHPITDSLGVGIGQLGRDFAWRCDIHKGRECAHVAPSGCVIINGVVAVVEFGTGGVSGLLKELLVHFLARATPFRREPDEKRLSLIVKPE